MFIRTERLHIYRGNTVYGPPDIVMAIHALSSRLRDRTVKCRLDERNKVPEYWQADADTRTLTIRVLNASGVYEPIDRVAGLLRSRVLPDLIMEVAALFAEL